MQESLLVAPPLPGSSKPVASLDARAIFLLATIGTVCMLVLNVYCRVFYTGDEGFYGVTAVNMLHSSTYVLRPAYFPDGDFFADKEGFAQPPFSSYFYALALWAANGALPSQELVHAVAFALLLYFAYRLLRLSDLQAGQLAVLLLVASPAVVFWYSLLEAEPLMTTFGIMALYFVLRGGFGAGQIGWLFIGALCIGFSFALKLWLCGPLALAVAAALGIRAWQTPVKLSRKALTLLLFGIVALLPAGLHLLAIASFYPQDVSFWMNSIYFGVFTSSGISGSKVSGAGVASNWVHPFWYYAPLLYRDHCFLVPIFLLGSGSVLRDRLVKPELLWVLLAGAAGLLPLSLLRVKEFLYVLTCVIFLYLLAGVCLAALLRRLASDGDVDPFSRKLGLAVTLGLLVLFPVAYALHLQPEKITGGFVLAHSLTLAFILAAFSWARRNRALPLERIAYGACILLVVSTFGYHAVTRKPRDQIIAGLIQPYVQNNSPRALSFIAANFKSFQLLAFRRGCYWDEVPLEQGPERVLASPQFANVRAFIVELKEEQRPEMAAWLPWLEGHAIDKTAELDARLGSKSGFRLFVR